ncbi:MAG: hypothetical protein HZY76_23365 [Anaerolineae bacterium]|nr:MAG: hypothetical protein HZY76_23365 [Anaerolineae bacterium]
MTAPALFLANIPHHREIIKAATGENPPAPPPPSTAAAAPTEPAPGRDRDTGDRSVAGGRTQPGANAGGGAGAAPALAPEVTPTSAEPPGVRRALSWFRRPAVRRGVGVGGRAAVVGCAGPDPAAPVRAGRRLSAGLRGR